MKTIIVNLTFSEIDLLRGVLFEYRRHFGFETPNELSVADDLERKLATAENTIDQDCVLYTFISSQPLTDYQTDYVNKAISSLPYRDSDNCMDLPEWTTTIQS